MRDPEGVGFEPADTLTAEQIYDRGWALALLEQVLARLGGEYRAAGPAARRLFDQLQRLLTDESDRPSQAEIAGELGMTGVRVRVVSESISRRLDDLAIGKSPNVGATLNRTRDKHSTQ